MADVREEGGVPFLAIELGDGKRLKTRSSRRRIPVHSDLIRLGFLTFVESRGALPEDASVQRSASHARVFPS